MRTTAAGLKALCGADLVALCAAPLAGLPHPSPKVLGCSAPLSFLRTSSFFHTRRSFAAWALNHWFCAIKPDSERVRRRQQGGPLLAQLKLIFLRAFSTSGPPLAQHNRRFLVPKGVLEFHSSRSAPLSFSCSCAGVRSKTSRTKFMASWSLD